ncbi:MAG TPA: nucleotide exchange factor GrpE [Bryobacteraceae bacterium]|nr:nucleotide exchange factor GrpE [Bryobacteraceae bacterium]
MEQNNVKTEEVSERSDNLDQLRIERDGLKAERDEARDLLLRRQAEFDNFRKRTERERSEYLQYAGMEMVKDLLPVLDDFERALQADSGSSDYAKGVAMIYNRMLETLKKLGLEPMETAGKPFDPHLHQAIERVETNEAEDNTVLGEFQRGYHFKGKLLRPAMVRVAVKP